MGMNPDDFIYCDCCRKVIPCGERHVSVNIQKETFIADDNVVVVDGMAEVVLQCHERCLPSIVKFKPKDYLGVK